MILLTDNASTTENTAAVELRHYIKEISGVELPISKTPKQGLNYIYIGLPKAKILDTPIQLYKDDDDGFTYKSIDNDLLIYGGRDRGTMYGVFAFLENELGVRWYTKDCTYIPHYQSFQLRAYNTTQKELIKYRYVEFKHFSSDPAVYAHNKMNMVWDALPTKYGKLHNYWGAHTSEWLVPSKDYFDTHPEFFSLRNGKRIPNSQLCLSNPKVLDLVKQNLKKVINPTIGYWCYDVSQNDNELFCECKNCKKLELQYGGHSGIWLWFVNQVADAFPNINIGTFAYQYTRKAPKNIKPRKNVVIRLCSIECCFAHPLSECKNNNDFMQDIKSWSTLTSNLFIWDYVVNFNEYLPPYPNTSVLAPNIKSFIKNHALAVFEQGQHTSGDGEFSELKAWVTSKLLWDPSLNTDSLIKDFIYGYYGKGAKDIEAYFYMCQSFLNQSKHMGCHMKSSSNFFDNFPIKQGLNLIASALQKEKNANIRKRIEMVELQLLYLHFARNRKQAIGDGTYYRFKQLLSKYKPDINEGIKAETFIKKECYI